MRVCKFLRGMTKTFQSINLGGLSIRAVVVSPCVLSQSSRKPTESETQLTGRRGWEGGYHCHRGRCWHSADFRVGGKVECWSAVDSKRDRTRHLYVPTQWTVHVMWGTADCKMPLWVLLIIERHWMSNCPLSIIKVMWWSGVLARSNRSHER